MLTHVLLNEFVLIDYLLLTDAATYVLALRRILSRLKCHINSLRYLNYFIICQI